MYRIRTKANELTTSQDVPVLDPELVFHAHSGKIHRVTGWLLVASENGEGISIGISAPDGSFCLGRFEIPGGGKERDGYLQERTVNAPGEMGTSTVRDETGIGLATIRAMVILPEGIEGDVGILFGPDPDNVAVVTLHPQSFIEIYSGDTDIEIEDLPGYLPGEI